MGIDRADHNRIIFQVQNQFRIQLNELEVNEAKLKHALNIKDEG